MDLSNGIKEDQREALQEMVRARAVANDNAECNGNGSRPRAARCRGRRRVSSVWVIGSIAQTTHPAGVAHIERH